jgi:hypothetical protein
VDYFLQVYPINPSILILKEKFLFECIIKPQTIECVGQENGIIPLTYLDKDNDKKMAVLCTDILG